MSWDISRGLRKDVGDSEYSAFVRRYVRMWPDRYSRLAAAIRDRDGEQAMNAALSIRSSSQMLGALKVARGALALERALRERKLQAAGDLLHELKTSGGTTLRLLSAGTLESEVEQPAAGKATERGPIASSAQDSIKIELQKLKI